MNNKTTKILAILLALTLIVSGTIISILLIKNNKKTDIVKEDNTHLSEKEESITEKETTEFIEKNEIEESTTQFTTTSSQEITNRFTGQKLTKLNLFLSNFSEMSFNNITNNEPDKMIDFVMLHTWFNDNSKYSNAYSRVFNGVSSTRSVSEAYMNERIKRFFDTEIYPRSTNLINYSDGRYYLPNADGEFHTSFSKVTSIYRNADGTLKVNFLIFKFHNYEDNILDNNLDIYAGLGDENVYNSTALGTGCAILKEKYFGEGYANYTVVSISSSVQYS